MGEFENQRALKNPTLQLAILAASAIGIALYTHAPCRSVFFADDSLMMIFVADLMVQQNIPWSDILLYPWAGNYHPLWLFQAFYQFELLGSNAPAWQIANIIFHALTAILLFIWTRAVTSTTFGPAMAALLWAGTIGGFRDDPAMVIFEAHYPLALFWLLLAMILGVKGIETGQRPWTAIGCLAATLAVASWEVALFGIPMAGLQHLMLRDRQLCPRRIDWVSVSAWIATFLLNGGLIAFVLMQGPPSPALGGNRGFLEWLGALLWHLVEAASSLLLLDPHADSSNFKKLHAAMAPCLLLMPWLDRRGWLAIFLLSAMPLGTIAAICAMRDEYLFYSGDYLYYSFMFFCLIIGLSFDGLRRRLETYRWLITLLSFLFLFSFAEFQRRKAQNLVVHESNSSRLVQENWESNKELLTSILLEPNSTELLRLPNIPLVLQPTYMSLAFSLDSFARIAGIKTGDKVVLVPLSEFTDQDSRKLRELLARHGSIKSSSAWVKQLDQVIPELQSVHWAATLLSSEGKFVQIPESTTIRYEDLRLEFGAEFISVLVGPWPSNLAFSPVSSISPQTIIELDSLAKRSSPKAQNWASFWERIRPR